MKRSRSSQPEPLSDVLQRFLKRSAVGRRVRQAAVIPEWPELVGEGIADATRPLRVSDGVLYVEVSSSAWMMELNMMRATLIARINAGRSREARIERIVFFLAGSTAPRPPR